MANTDNYDVYMIADTWMGVWVHEGPGVNYKKIKVIYGQDKEQYKVTKRQNNYWLYIPDLKGWVCDRDSNDMIVMKKVENSSKAKTVDTKKTTNTKTNKNNTIDEESFAYVPDYEILQSSNDAFTANLENNLTISNLRGVFGMPYQFMASVDPRVTDKTNSIGRKYAKEIVTQMPLLLMTPGKPVFMSKFTDNDKKNILSKFINAAAGNETNINDTVLSETFGKYYSLEYAYNDYFQYVNPMCRIAARIMNLQDKTVDGTKLESYNWAQNTNSNFNKLFSVYRHCTAWYCESDNSISDSFSNGTSESMIASKINSLSDYGRELNFLLGTVKSNTGLALDRFVSEENLNTNMETVNQMLTSALGSGVGGIFSSITNSAQTIASGGKLVFPELWSDSQFSRSYNVNLKLVSPDGDDLSIYLNIIVPMLHLLGLVLPREAPKSHGYIAPFLVRAFYKGLFNVDMGIITDLTFTKGKDSAWTLSGLPTTVDVSFTIKDLYSDMYMSSMDNMKHNMLSNIILMDYIANLCGVNINEVDVFRGIDLFLIQNVKNRVTDTWHMKMWGSLDQWVSNKWQNLFGKF